MIRFFCPAKFSSDTLMVEFVIVIDLVEVRNFKFQYLIDTGVGGGFFSKLFP